MSATVPLVDYLVLGDQPHLTAHECASCRARFFDRRNACASCGALEFETVDVPTEGELTAFTIVAFAAPGVPVPFVAGVIDCQGTAVRANIVNIEPSAENVQLGMKVRLTTFPLGTDNQGVEAIGFGFEPIDGRDQS
ncbi:MAG: Zn-ribbon domain-containing OB-fold protein [Acidimicrobiales bacterium]